jgi:hypothetical protein
MKITYDKEPRCYICHRTHDDLNHFHLQDQKQLQRSLEKARKDRDKHIKNIKRSNKKLYEKHIDLAKKNSNNYEFSMEVIKKDFNAFEKMIPDLKELVDAYENCDMVNQESKLIDVIKIHKDYHNEKELTEDDKEIRKIEYEIELLDSVMLKFQTISTKLEYLTDIKSFDIKGTKYENMVVSVNICPNCEKLIQKFG